MASLTTRDKFKAYMGISVTTWDALIDDVLLQVSDAIEDYCSNVFAEATYVEQYNGDSQRTLQLKHYPVTSITEIREDAARVFDASSVIPVANYTFDSESGNVYMDSWRFGFGLKSIKVTYVAGYSSTPRPVTLACHKLMGAIFNKRKDDGQTGASLGGVTFTYSKDWPEDVLNLLEPYVSNVQSE